MPTKVRPFSKKKSTKSANIITKKKTNKKKNTKQVVASSFKQAYQALQPSKELRLDFNDIAMDTATSMASRSHATYLDTIAQGTQMNQRLGCQIHMSYLHARISVANNSTVKTKAFRVLLLREVNYGGLPIGSLTNLFKAVGTGTHTPGS